MPTADPADDLAAIYPVGEKQPERVQTRNGLPLSELSLESVLAGRATAADFGITAAGLRLQADIAQRAGRPHLAQNLRRGAELVDIPAEVIFEIYELLRPGRARQAADLLAAAARLRQTYAAEETARLLDEAALAYARRGLLGRRFTANSPA